MITVGNIHIFAISFIINKIMRTNTSHSWVYGHFIVHINGKKYGNEEDLVSLEHCTGWIQSLISEHFEEYNPQYKKLPLDEYRNLSMEKIVEMINAVNYHPPKLDNEYLKKIHSDYTNNCDHRQYMNKCMALVRDTNITNIGMSSFDSINLLLLMIDYSNDLKRFIVIEYEKRSHVCSEYHVSASAVHDVLCSFLERYEYEKLNWNNAHTFKW
ncbi:MAG: hypothetical protein Q4G68_06865 [Planctomycetia bacterium]|nr:hypothetical protein [Planctomycetia bacterium]